MFELDIDVDADICTHVLNESDDNWSVPKQLVPVEFVVMVVVSIASLKVTVREVFGATDEAESAGVVEETVGAVVSGVLEVVKPDECV